jgi:hypothetical protein
MRIRRALWTVPWGLGAVGLAVPMVGSGFIGWPFVVAWLVLLTLVWLVRPVSGAGRSERLGAGLLTVVALALLGTLGGFYLVPAVVAWMALVATEPQGRPGLPRSLPEQPSRS